MALDSVLARIPGLGGYLASQEVNRRQDIGELQQMGLLQQIYEMQQQRQANEVLRQSGGDINAAIPKLLQMGAAGRKAAADLMALQEHGQKLSAATRENAFFSPENRARFTTPGTPEIPPAAAEIGGGPGRPAVPAQFDIKRFATEGVMQGVKGTEPLLTHLGTQETNRIRMAEAAQARRDALEARLYDIETRSQDRNATREQQLFLANQADATRREMAALGRAVTQSNRRPIATATGLYDPNTLQPMTDPNTGERLRAPTMTGGTYERGVSKDFESHPAVKAYVELQPDVQTVNNYMQRRPTVPVSERAVYDRNLANTFMRLTHPKGDQISNFDKKDLAGLPTLPDRIVRAIVGTLAGSYIPDDVAEQMAKLINDKYAVRKDQVIAIENKMIEDVKRHGGSPEAIRRISGPKPIANEAEYNAVPSGAQYVAPDGSTRTKR